MGGQSCQSVSREDASTCTQPGQTTSRRRQTLKKLADSKDSESEPPYLAFTNASGSDGEVVKRDSSMQDLDECGEVALCGTCTPAENGEWLLSGCLGTCTKLPCGRRRCTGRC